MNLKEIYNAQKRLKGVAHYTPLEKNVRFSMRYNASVYFKREDLQPVRSYKIRGAYNTIAQLDKQGPEIVCASAGNHAQGVAYSCALLKKKGCIFMPVTTPLQKVNQVRSFGGQFVEVKLEGDTFDDSYAAAKNYCDNLNATFIHPFDNDQVIAGQGTVGLELLEQIDKQIDIIILPVGGGGLAAGVSTVFKQLCPKTKIIGVEPAGAPSMSRAMQAGKCTTLDSIDKFVDGAAVKRVGERNFDLCKNQIDEMICVPEGRVCSKIIQLYNEEGMVVEPAGVLSIAALESLNHKELKGKTVVCVISGGNNDVLRMDEIRERSLMYEGLKHYFMIEFPQRPGTLKNFVTNVLGTEDDITYFQFAKKNQKETGPAVIGIEVNSAKNFKDFNQRLKLANLQYVYLNDNALLFSQLIG